MRRFAAVLGFLGLLALPCAIARAAEADAHTPLPRPAFLPEDAFAVGVVRSYARFTGAVVRVADASHAGTGQAAKALMEGFLQGKVAVQLFDPNRPVAIIALDPKKYREDCVIVLAPVADYAGYVKKIGEIHGAAGAEGDGFAEFEVVQPGAAPDKKLRIQDAGAGYVVLASGDRAAEAAAATAAALKAAGGRAPLGPATDDVRVLVDLAKLTRIYEKEIAEGLKKGRQGMKMSLAMISGMLGAAGGAPAAGAAPGAADGRCRENLQMLAIGCQMYAIDHDGAFPDKLETLLKNYVDAKKCFSCPVRGGTGTDYVYVAGLRTDDKGGTILAFDRKGNHADGTANVVFVNGEFKSLKAEDLARQVAAQMAAFEKAGRKIVLVEPPAPGAAPEEAGAAEAAPGPATIEEFGKEFSVNFLAVIANLVDPGFDLAGALTGEFAGAELLLTVKDAPRGAAAPEGDGRIVTAVRLYPAKGSRAARIVSEIGADRAEMAALAKLLPTERCVVLSVGGNGATNSEAGRAFSLEFFDALATASRPIIPEDAFWRASTGVLRAFLENSRSNANAQLARSDTAQANLIVQRVKDPAAVRAAIGAWMGQLAKTKLFRDLARFGVALEYKAPVREHAGAKVDRIRLKLDFEKLMPGEAMAMQRKMIETMLTNMFEMQLGAKEPAVDLAYGKDLFLMAYGKNAEDLADGILDRAAGAADGGDALAGTIAAAPEGWIGASEIYPIRLLRLAWVRQKKQQQLMMQAMGAAPGELKLPDGDDRHPVRLYGLREGSMLELRFVTEVATIKDISAFVKKTFLGGIAGAMKAVPNEAIEIEELEEILE